MVLSTLLFVSFNDIYSDIPEKSCGWRSLQQTITHV